MAIQQLTEEQIRNWTPAQKDRWWLENVYRGDMPQLTLRAALMGMLLGGLLSLTNLVLGLKIGWSMGVGITSVILAFGLFRLLGAIGLAREFTILENNCMQSVAAAAGYMTAPLTSSLAAYALVTGKTLSMWVMMLWIVGIALMGVFLAFPIKRRFINEEQLPFPEGQACAYVLESLHESTGALGVFQAKLLAFWAVVSALFELAKTLAFRVFQIPSFFEGPLIRALFKQEPAILGTPITQLGFQLYPDQILFATGGLMGVRMALSVALGAVINYLVVVPVAISNRWIVPVDGEYGIRAIGPWALWGGVAVMTTSSFVALLSRSSDLGAVFRLGRIRRDRVSESGEAMRAIELPLSVSAIGILLVTPLLMFLGSRYLGLDLWLILAALPVAFICAMIGANATGVTGITSTGTYAKLTQLTFATWTRTPAESILTAGIPAEAAANASNLLMDIKPGYLLGAKPRHQAAGHVLGILAGAIVCVPVYHYMFLKDGVAELQKRGYPLPGALPWKAFAEIMVHGIKALPPYALGYAVAGALAGVILEMLRIATRGRFWLSPIGIGMGCILPFDFTIPMVAGAACFWFMASVLRKEGTPLRRIFADHVETLCAGVIAGGSLMMIGIELYGLIAE